MLPVAMTARELVNVSRITMNEGMVGALSCDDTAAGIQANAPRRVERMKWRVLRCAHAKQMEWRICVKRRQQLSFGCGVFGCVFAYPRTRELPSQQCYHWPCTLLEGENGQPHTAENVIV